MHGVMATRRRANCIKASRIALLGAQSIIAPLPIGATDRMNRGQIKDVKSERRDVGQTTDTIIESAMATGNASLAARHHFVPGAGTGARPVHHKRVDRAAAQVRPFAAFRRSSSNFVRQQEIDGLDHVGGSATLPAPIYGSKVWRIEPRKQFAALA